jgi:hypothetical protein
MPKNDIQSRNKRRIVRHPWGAEVRRWLRENRADGYAEDVEEYVHEFEHLEGKGCWYCLKVRRRFALSYRTLDEDFDMYLDATYGGDPYPY